MPVLVRRNILKYYWLFWSDRKYLFYSNTCNKVKITLLKPKILICKITFHHIIMYFFYKMAIFFDREMRKYSFNHLLIVLSGFDLVFIMCSLPVHTFPIFGVGGWLYAKLYQHILYPFTSVSFTGSIYMTLAITIER